MHYLTHFSIGLGSWLGWERAEWWVRILPSLLPGLLSIYGLYWLGLQWRRPRLGLLASFLLSISSLHVFYSQELRPYSLPVVWAVLSTGLLLKRRWGWFVLCSILGLYSSYLYPFFLIGQLVYLLWIKLPWRQLLLVLAAIFLAYLPWLPKFYEQFTTGQALRESMPGWERVVSLPQLKTALLVPAKFIFGVLDLEPTWPFLGLGGVVVSISGYLLLHKWRRGLRRPSDRQIWQILLTCLALPLLLSWLVSFVVPVLQAKRVLLLLPFWSLFLAWLISQAAATAQAASTWSARLARILLLALLTIGVWANTAYWTTPALQRENWRSLQTEISTRFNPSHTILVFGFDQAFASWRHYDQGQFPTFASGSFDTSRQPQLAEEIKVIDRYQYVLLFDYLLDLTDRERRLEQLILELGFREAGVLDYPVLGFVRIYAKNNLASLTVTTDL